MKKSDDINIAEKIAECVSQIGGTCYFVGGYIRDKIMENPGKDVDIEVHGITPSELEAILDSIGTRIETGKSFGVYNLKGYNIDIAMPRKEKCTGRGHRDFKVYIDPFLGTEKASIRRDFTINAIMENVLTGEIIDHFGGQKDIKEKVIRHINSDTFIEDPLRVLRGAQFASRFDFAIAPETIELCKSMNMDNLASERIFEEMKKALLKSEKPSAFFEALREMDALHFWFAELFSLIGIEQNKQHHKEGDAWNHTMMVLDEAAKRRNSVTNPMGFMLAALCHDFGKAICTEEVNGVIHSYKHEALGLPLVEKFLKRITTDKKLIKYVLNMTALHMRPNMLYAQSSKIKATNRMFDEAVAPYDLIQLAMSDNLGKIPREAGENTEKFLLERLDIFKEYMSRDYVTGKDLIEMGLNEGEAFSEILQFAHKMRIAGVKKENVIKQIKSEYKKEV